MPEDEAAFRQPTLELYEKQGHPYHASARRGAARRYFTTGSDSARRKRVGWDW